MVISRDERHVSLFRVALNYLFYVFRKIFLESCVQAHLSRLYLHRNKLDANDHLCLFFLLFKNLLLNNAHVFVICKLK